jgi:aldose sugar dehydrogenase
VRGGTLWAPMTHLSHPLALALVVAAPACSAAPQASAPTAMPQPPEASRPVPRDAPLDPSVRNVAATAGRGNAPATLPPFTLEPQGRFAAPFAMAFLPDGRLLVTEKAGVLKLRGVDGAMATVAGTPAVATGGQGGLLDVAVAPDFARSGTVYLSFAEAGAQGAALALMRARLVTDGAPRLADARVIWRSGSNGPGGQFGATIAFAPDGKSLFLASGERQRFTPAQDPEQALGKILRLTPDGAAWPGNPFYKQGGVRAMTWSSGHRNPYGLAFDAGGRLWEEEMGPRGGDELNLIESGRNYGWPLVSNGDNYSGQPIPDHPSRPAFAAPAVWWNPSISPGGMVIVSGRQFPAWRGSALIAALGGKALIRVRLDGARATPAEHWDLGTRIRDVAEAPDGTVWLLEDGGQGAQGQLFRLRPR